MSPPPPATITSFPTGKKQIIEEVFENGDSIPYNGAAALTPTDIEKLFAFSDDETAASTSAEKSKKKKRKRGVKLLHFYIFFRNQLKPKIKKRRVVTE